MEIITAGRTHHHHPHLISRVEGDTGYSFPIYHQPISGTSISPTSASGVCPQLSLSHLQGAELQLCGGDYPKIH